jgi:hypothetical protein
MTEADKNAMEEVLAEFFTLDGDVYRQRRIDEELARAIEISGKRREAANAKHRKSPAHLPANALQMQTQPQPQPQGTTKAKPCARPSLEEVTAYCRERGNKVDPQQWFDHYSSNGWRVGRNPMRDWRAAVRTWERNGSNRHADLDGPNDNQFLAARPDSAMKETNAPRLEYRLPPNLDSEAGEQLWSEIRQKVSKRVNPHSFETWFKPAKAAGLAGNTLYVKLPTPNFSHVGEKYTDLISELTGGALEIEFIVPQEVSC